MARLFRTSVPRAPRFRQARRLRFRNHLRLERLEDRSLMASLVWSPSPSLPLPRSDAAAILAADDSIYLLGGNTNAVQVKASGASDWSTGPSIDKERVAPGAGPLNNGHIVLFGGLNAGQAIEETYLYEPLDLDPQDGASMSTTRAQGAYATDPQSGSVFVFGGVDEGGTILSSAEKYSPTADNWMSVASLPDSRTDFAAAADGAGHIFVFGGRRAGFGSNDVSSQVYRYDVATNTWQTMSSMPIALRDLTAVSGPNDGKIYVIGGRNAAGPVSSVYAYDYVSNTWAVETNLITAVADAAAVLDADGRIVVLGGRNALGQIISDVQVTQDLDAVDSLPAFVSLPVTTATSTVAYSYQVIATGNPLPTFQLTDPPTGMTIDALGSIHWIPNEAHVGTQTITVRATNRAGFVDQVFSIAVASSVPLIRSTPVTTAGTGAAYHYDVNATGAPAPSFTLTELPIGMTIDANSGVIAWTPTVSQAGLFSVTVVASNTHGSNQQSFVINVADQTVPTTPTSLTVASTSINSIALSWNPSSDNVGVAKYRVYEQYKYGWRNSRTGYRLKQDNIPSPVTAVSGLAAGTSYKLVVTAVDAAGNESLRSNLIIATTLKLPTIAFYNGSQSGVTNVAAMHEMFPIQVYGSGVPTPTLSLVSGPSGLTFDPSTGVAHWTPTDAQVGTHTATFQATNSQGNATIAATINVQPNLPVLSKTFAYFGTSFSTPFAVEGDPFELQLYETFTNSPITWSIVSGPTEMSIDPATGTVGWIPGAADVGVANAVFRATNYAGSTDLPVTFTVHPLGTDLRAPTPVNGITVSVIDSTRAAVTWIPAADNVGIESYRITSSYRYKSGRFSRTVTKVFSAAADTTMFEMTGLSARSQNVYIQAIDAAGNVSPVGQVVNFTPVANPSFPSISLTGPQPSGVVVGQLLHLQITDTNATPREYSLITAPVGASIDATSGLISWTPAYANVGSATMTVRATNVFGYRDYTLTFPVYFTGAVQNVAYIQTGANSATASWTPPADTSHVAGYYVYQRWSINGHTYSYKHVIHSPTTTSLSGIYLVGGPVVHKISVVAFDDLGQVGLTGLTVGLA